MVRDIIRAEHVSGGRALLGYDRLTVEILSNYHSDWEMYYWGHRSKPHLNIKQLPSLVCLQ